MQAAEARWRPFSAAIIYLASVRLALVLPLVRREVAVVFHLDFSLAYGVADLFNVIGAFVGRFVF